MSNAQTATAQQTHGLTRAVLENPVERLQAAPPLRVRLLLLVWLFCGACASLVLFLLNVPMSYAWKAGFVVMLVCGAGPLVGWLLGLLLHGVSLPILSRCSPMLQLIYGVALVGQPVTLVLRPFVDGLKGQGGLFFPFVGGILFVMAVPALSGRRIWRGLRPAAAVADSATPVPPSASAPSVATPAASSAPVAAPFGLCLGISTGKFAELGHGANIAAGQQVTFGISDAAMNTVIYGGIGSGKTTRLINPLLLQALRQDTGVLVFNVKGDFAKEMDYLARAANRPYQVIGDGGDDFNLLEGLTAEEAAGFLRSAFTKFADGKGGGDGEFWIGNAVEYCRNALGLLRYFPAKYTLYGLYRYVYDKAEQTTVEDAVRELRHSGDLSEFDQRLIDAHLFYFENVFRENATDKVGGSINMTIAQVLAPFAHPALVDAFCTHKPDGDSVRLEDLPNKGAVFRVDIPEDKFGRAGSELAFLFVKLRFMRVMRTRRVRPEWNQSRPVVFMSDEYHRILDAASDNEFWDLSRSAKTVGIVAMQGFSSAIDRLGGSREKAQTVMQNFRQTVCMRTEDEPTISRISKLLGKVDVATVSASQRKNTGTSAGGASAGQNTNRSISMRHQELIDAQFFRQLDENEAVAILNIAGKAADDVLAVSPIYVE